jgi:hypothetical protein
MQQFRQYGGEQERHVVVDCLDDCHRADVSGFHGINPQLRLAARARLEEGEGGERALGQVFGGVEAQRIVADLGEQRRGEDPGEAGFGPFAIHRRHGLLHGLRNNRYAHLAHL